VNENDLNHEGHEEPAYRQAGDTASVYFALPLSLFVSFVVKPLSS